MFFDKLNKQWQAKPSVVKGFKTITIVISNNDKKRKWKCTDEACEKTTEGSGTEFRATQGFKLQDILKDHGNAGIPPTVGSLFKGAGSRGGGKTWYSHFRLWHFFLPRTDKLIVREARKCTSRRGGAHSSIPSVCNRDEQRRGGKGGGLKSVVLTGPNCASTSPHIHKKPLGTWDTAFLFSFSSSQNSRVVWSGQESAGKARLGKARETD